MRKNLFDRFIAVMFAILIVCPLVTSHGYDDLVSSAESSVSVNALGHGAEEYRTSVNKDAAVVTIPAAESPKAVVTTAASAKETPQTTTTAKRSYASFNNCWRTGSAVPRPSIKLYSETKTVAKGETLRIDADYQYMQYIDFESSGYMHFRYNSTSFTFSGGKGYITVEVSCDTPPGTYTVYAKGYHPEYEGPDEYKYASGSISFEVIDPAASRTTTTTTRTTTTTTTTTTRTTTTTTTTSTTWTTTTMTYPIAEVHLGSYDKTVAPGSTIEIGWNSRYANSVYVGTSSKNIHCEKEKLSVSYYADSGTLEVSIAPDTPDGTYCIDMWGENRYNGRGDITRIYIEVKYPFVIGDVNLDGTMSIADAVTLQRYLLQTGELKQWRGADINNDRVIDVFDLCLLKKKLLKNDLVSTK